MLIKSLTITLILLALLAFLLFESAATLGFNRSYHGKPWIVEKFRWLERFQKKGAAGIGLGDAELTQPNSAASPISSTQSPKVCLSLTSWAVSAVGRHPSSCLFDMDFFRPPEVGLHQRMRAVHRNRPWREACSFNFEACHIRHGHNQDTIGQTNQRKKCLWFLGVFVLNKTQNTTPNLKQLSQKSLGKQYVGCADDLCSEPSLVGCCIKIDGVDFIWCPFGGPPSTIAWRPASRTFPKAIGALRASNKALKICYENGPKS